MYCHIRVDKKLPTLPSWLDCDVQGSQAGKLSRDAQDSWMTG